MIYIPPKLLGYGLVLLAVAIVAGTLYGCGRKDKADATSLKVARETIKVEREALKIARTIDMRVNAEGIQTAKTAQEAASEIESIRSSRDVKAPAEVRSAAADTHSYSTDSGGAVRCDDSCTRVLQLAREARAAALASGARLQSEGTGAR